MTERFAENLVMYRCPQCMGQFFSTETDPVCPCGGTATLSECQDGNHTEATLLSENKQLRRTIYALVSAAGGRAEVSFMEMEATMCRGATLSCYYDVATNRQVWRTSEAVASMKLLEGKG